MRLSNIKTSIESGKILEETLPDEYVQKIKQLCKVVMNECGIVSSEYEVLKMLLSLTSDMLLLQKKEETSKEEISLEKKDLTCAMDTDEEDDWKVKKPREKKQKIQWRSRQLNPKARKFIPEKQTKVEGKEGKFKQVKFKFPWKKGKTFWLRKKNGGDRLDGDMLKRFVDFLNLKGYNVQHWISLAVGGIKIATSSQIKVPMSIEFEDSTFDFWFPSTEIKRSLVVYRVEEMEEDKLKKLLDEEFLNLNLVNIEYKLMRLGSRKSGQWKPTSAYKLSGLNDDVINFMVNRKFISLNSKAAPVRIFHNNIR